MSVCVCKFVFVLLRAVVAYISRLLPRRRCQSVCIESFCLLLFVVCAREPDTDSVFVMFVMTFYSALLACRAVVVFSA